MAKTKFFRVATSGATTDGRTINPQDLVDMASTYDPATYQARVNLEHYMAMSPESAFGAYGDVLSLKTDTVTLNVGGKDQQRTALYAEIDALDPLVALKDKKQKLFTSIEVIPNFAASGKAYLGGLAFTDNPASLGTEMMKFCAQAGEASPLHFRKSRADAVVTAAEETTFEFAEATPGGLPGPDPEPETNGIIDAIKRALRGFSIVPAPAPDPLVAPAAADPAVATAFTELGDVMTRFATLNAAQAARIEKIATDFAALTVEATKLRTDLTAALAQVDLHKAALEKVAPTSFRHRASATGGGGATAEDEIL